MVQLHEFEADARTVERDEVDLYCCLLAKAALKSSGYQLANHFTNSLTLKRIEMMKTVKAKISNWKALSVLVAVLIFCLVVGWDRVYDQVDELPTFGSGQQYNEVYEFIARNLQYPDEARRKGIEGKVLAKFVVEKDGTITNVAVVKGIGYGCDEATVRVVKLLPKWNPGKKDGRVVRTRFTLPIVFQLSQPKKTD